MKSAFLVLMLSNCFFSSLGQEGNPNMNPKPVKVINWMRSFLLFPEGFWEGDKKVQIVSQIGKEEFEKVKKYSQHKFLPQEMLVFNSRKGLLRDTSEFKQKLNSLNVFKIASYSHWAHDKYWGEYAILRVPFSDNKNWDSTAKWDTVYFVIPEVFIESIPERKR